MSKIKLILTDLDGTLVRPEADVVSDDVAACIKEGEAQGLKFAAVTGRPYWMAKDLLQTIGFQDPCIFEGGGIIMNPATEEILWSKTVSVETTRRAVEQLVRHASIIEYGSGVKKTNEVNTEVINEPALSIWASVPAETAEDLVYSLSELPDVAVHANAGPAGDSSRTGIQVTHIAADKEHAVIELLRILNVDTEHTLGIGDGNNDLPLLRSAAIKIAMGNASDGLKAAADHVVSDVTHDGFAEAIRRYALN